MAHSPDYIVTGNITSFEERGKGTVCKAYKFNLNLINNEDGDYSNDLTSY